MKVHKLYILTWGAMLLLFMILLVSLIKLYGIKEAIMKETVKNELRNSLIQYNQLLIDTDIKGQNLVSSYSNSVVIHKDDKKFIFTYNSDLIASEKFNTALYDIRKKTLWSLQGLDSLFCRQIHGEAVNYILELQDST